MFDPQDIFTPTAIGRIDHFLDELNTVKSLNYNLEILDQFGDVMKVSTGNEAPHLTATQITQLQTFVNSRRLALPTTLNFGIGNILGRTTWRVRDGDGSVGSRSIYVRAIEQTALDQLVQVHQINDQSNLSQAQLTAITTFLDTQRTKATNEILP
jgi:hypothetical protein